MNGIVCGIGVNNASYKVTKYVDGKKEYCPFYTAWKSMLSRCYNKNIKGRKPAYDGCTVCEEWLLFSNFKAWMEKQDWKAKQLDKDLLVKGNKMYSPDACAFVCQTTNAFLTNRAAMRGKYLIGVTYRKNLGKYVAACRNPFDKKSCYIGVFDTEMDAHQAWKSKKIEYAKKLSVMQSDERVANALFHMSEF